MTTVRRAIVRAAPAPVPMPGDVRLMNAVASTVFLLAALAVLAAAGLWLMRSPAFAIRGILLDGDLARNSVPTIRANAAPLLSGNFFSADLAEGRAAFESVPWVRRALVRRVWPDRLSVRLEEHRAVALWQGGADDGGVDRLVNSQGEIFEANVGDVEDDRLPIFSGPEGQSAQMLAVYQRLQPVVVRLDAAVTRLRLTGRGSWRLELDTGAVLELGRGSREQIVARTERFARTYGQVAAQWSQPLERADLRHADGYAVRLRGVGTLPAAATKATVVARKH